MLPTVLHLASCHHFSFPAIDFQCLLLHSYPIQGQKFPTVHIFLFNSLFLSMLPTVSHHPSPCYHLSFPKRDFSAYFLLPFLSDSREKMFLLSSFSCLKLRFLSILPTVLHHPSFYISPFQILTFSVYLRLPFLSDSRAKTFLLSTFSCLQ